MRSILVAVSFFVTLLGCAHGPQTRTAEPMPPSGQSARALLLEKNEGERRQWRYPGFPAHFILKVDPRNGRSSHLVLGTEAISPGEKIEMHEHPRADEILFLQSGQAKVSLGGVVREVHSGATVFIPANTWVSLANNGKETIDMIFIFSAPGFEDFMRAESAPAGQKIVLVTPAEDASLLKKYKDVVIYK